ncbi:hypothetical protein KUTeg_014305 [Tegillarca granosa]|uniref:Uncharacterized protein n=1 Tax=Tegillarca granosa TaxID=220873 RepID=A0ABQ9EZR2_TEGGR|nr:hypothetical protein KUTeg_014305 [Tegillarca granosa]
MNHFCLLFLITDGSVQHAAAIQPIGGCELNRCPILLTLHGTTVPPQNQADSYKQMIGNKFVFGVEGTWVLAPTRHGAHNWEGPGALTAMTAVDHLVTLSDSCTWISNKADPQSLIYAGHSMGGHGSWHLATHYPDRGLALLSLAGWIKKEEYGDSNLFFKHDLSTSYTDPAVKYVMEACIAENDADRHVSNIQNYLERNTGGGTQKIPMMVVLLMINSFEILPPYTPLPPHQPVPRKIGECTGIKNNIYVNQKKHFTLTTYNPALGDGYNGIKILQQITPFRPSKVQVDGEVISKENLYKLLDHQDVCLFKEKGTQGNDKITKYIQKLAVYIANLFFLTSDTAVSIFKDSEVDLETENRNVILIGGLLGNRHIPQFLQKIPLNVNDNRISLEDCSFTDDRNGFLSLAPHGSNNLALLLMGNSLRGLLDVVTLATPTIPPMTRSPFSNLLPDFVVTGPEFGLKGPGGFHCAGFWGNKWEYRSDLSSCVCNMNE